MASNSSSNSTHGILDENSNTARIFFAVLPRKEEISPSRRATYIGSAKRREIYAARWLLPQPGGPYNRRFVPAFTPLFCNSTREVTTDKKSSTKIRWAAVS